MDCYLFAPAGTFDPAILNQRMARLQQYFALVHYSPMPTAGYFAGSLSDRVAQIQQALRLIENKGEPAWLMAVRGGYGAIDLLPQIPDLASDTPIVLSGFSDMSVLLNTWGRSESVLPVYGLNALASFAPEVDPASIGAITRIIEQPYQFQYSGSELQTVQILNPGRMQGEIVGGCLTVFMTTIGTPFVPDVRGKILFFEDVNEPAYKIDRMLGQLAYGGYLDHLAGAIFGDFSGGEATGHLPLEGVIAKYFGGRQYPVLYNFPMGHGNRQLPVVFYRNTEIVAKNGKIDWRYG